MSCPKHNNPIPFEAKDFVHASRIIPNFFQNNQDMLPAPLRARIFSPAPPQDPADPAPERNINWSYVIGGGLGLLLIGFIAQKVLKYIRSPQPIQS